MKKLAITGGIASGKTTVCKLFQKLGAYTVSADEIVHNLLSTDPLVKEKVLKILNLKEPCDRQLIAKAVFEDLKKLKDLEEVLHPKVFEEIERLYEEAKKQNKYPLFIAEVPLFYESVKTPPFDAVICVFTDETLAEKRFEQKGFSKDEFNQRMKRQLPTAMKLDSADYRIDNNGSFALLEKNVSDLFSLLTLTR